MNNRKLRIWKYRTFKDLLTIRISNSISNPAYSIDELVFPKSITVSPGMYDSLSVESSKSSETVSVEEVSSSVIVNDV